MSEEPRIRPSEPVLAALRALVERLRPHDIVWALTGSLGHVLQGVDLEVGDIDLQTDRDGAYRIAGVFAAELLRPVEMRPGERVRSHYGAFELAGVAVEIMGDLETREPDGPWSGAPDVAGLRVRAEIDGLVVPVMPLEHEWKVYARYGRLERAELLRRHAESARR